MKDQTVSSRADKLDYLRTMLKQLEEMAREEKCDMLAYLIEMAHIEASDMQRLLPLPVKPNKRHRTA